MKGFYLAIVAAGALLIAQSAAADTFTSAGLELHYSITGKGSPVVLLAGGPGFDPDYLNPVGLKLARDHTVILLEQRGTGHSVPAISNATTINEGLLVTDLEALRKKLGYERWALLGHSFGTFTAMRYAIAYPEHASRLLLLGTMAPKSTDDTLEANIGKRVAPENLARIGKLNSGWTKATPAQRDAIMLEISKIVLPAYLYDQRNAATVLAGMPAGSIKSRTGELLNAETANYDLSAGLAKLSLPVLIVQGAKDPLDPVMAAKTQAAIPGAKLIVLEQSGHFAWIEAPDQLAAAMHDFLSN